MATSDNQDSISNWLWEQLKGQAGALDALDAERARIGLTEELRERQQLEDPNRASEETLQKTARQINALLAALTPNDREIVLILMELQQL